MSSFKTSYSGLLATLYWDTEAMLAEFGDRVALTPAASEALWARFEGLRHRFAALRHEADEMLSQGGCGAGHEAAVRVFMAELELLLDVEHEGDDWESYVGAAVIHAGERIVDEARSVEHWS